MHVYLLFVFPPKPHLSLGETKVNIFKCFESFLLLPSQSRTISQIIQIICSIWKHV